MGISSRDLIPEMKKNVRLYGFLVRRMRHRFASWNSFCMLFYALAATSKITHQKLHKLQCNLEMGNNTRFATVYCRAKCHKHTHTMCGIYVNHHLTHHRRTVQTTCGHKSFCWSIFIRKKNIKYINRQFNHELEHRHTCVTQSKEMGRGTNEI